MWDADLNERLVQRWYPGKLQCCKVHSVSKLSKPQIRTLAAMTNDQKLFRTAPTCVATVDQTPFQFNSLFSHNLITERDTMKSACFHFPASFGLIQVCVEMFTKKTQKLILRWTKVVKPEEKPTFGSWIN